MHRTINDDRDVMLVEVPQKAPAAVLIGPPCVALLFAVTVSAIIAAIRDAGADATAFVPLETGGWVAFGLFLLYAAIGIGWPRVSIFFTLITATITLAAALVFKDNARPGVTCYIIDAIATSAMSAAGIIFALGIAIAYAL